MEPALVRAERVTRRFGSTVAVREVTLDLIPGETVALVGDNGAGKTTLARLLAGQLAPDQGIVRRNRAREGVSLVPQHPHLAGNLTVAENLLLSAPSPPALLTRRNRVRAVNRLFELAGLSISAPDRRAAELSIGEQVRVELVRALASSPDLLILDEPTSVLAPVEVKELATLLRSLSSRRLGILVITHKLAEVEDLAQRVVVMRDGVIIDEQRAEPRLDRARILAALGVSAETIEAPSAQSGERVLELRGVTTPPAHARVSLQDLTLALHAGEVAAVVGAAGNGQKELIEVLRGIAPIERGGIRLRNAPVSRRELQTSRSTGFIPADRSREGIIPSLSVAENVTLKLPVSSSERRRAAMRAIERFGIRTAGPDATAESLSGGNQQKVILARELTSEHELLIAGEPARGLDVQTARTIRQHLVGVARRGGAVLLVTSDLDEALEIASTIHVMFRGRITGSWPAAEARDHALAAILGIGG